MAKAKETKEPQTQFDEEQRFEIFEAVYAQLVAHSRMDADIVTAARKAKRAVEVAEQEYFNGDK